MNNKQRTKCEVYSRVVGYLRPIKNWNDGKLAEFNDRVNFEVKDDK